MRKSIKTIVSLILVLCMVIAEGTVALAEENTQVDVKNLDSTEWMNYLPDESYVSAMNIPGSHDSGLYNANNPLSAAVAQCQSMDILDQLNAGVRFFDIRLRYDEDKKDLYVCHGQGGFCQDGYTSYGNHYTYYLVLYQMALFLEEHPSETVFFFVKNEYLSSNEKNPKHDDYSPVRINEFKNALYELENAFNNSLLQQTPFEHKHEIQVLDNTNNYSEFYNKTLGECRGNIIRFQDETDFGDLMNARKFNDYGASYTDKWDNLKPYFDSAPDQDLFLAKTKKYQTEEYEQNNPDTFRAAFTSCTGMYTYNQFGELTWNNIGGKTFEIFDVFDWIDDDAPGVPTGGDEAKHLNPFLMNYPFDSGAYYGWIAMDMVTNDLARLIFQTNDFNQTGRIHSEKPVTYIKDIQGFCALSYDTALEDCYDAGYTPLKVFTSNGKPSYNVNILGYPIVLGYKTTTNPNDAITDIVGRYDEDAPKGCSIVTINSSLYDRFTRGTELISGQDSADPSLFVTKNKSKAPIRELEILYDTYTEYSEGIVSENFTLNKPEGSTTVFNLQKGMKHVNGNPIFVGLKMIRDDSTNNYGTIFGTGSIIIIVACIIILALAVLLMLEKRKSATLKSQLTGNRPTDINQKE